MTSQISTDTVERIFPGKPESYSIGERVKEILVSGDKCRVYDNSPGNFTLITDSPNSQTPIFMWVYDCRANSNQPELKGYRNIQPNDSDYLDYFAFLEQHKERK